MALVLALGLSACGGGDNTAAEAVRYPAMVPRPHFEREANVVCEESRERVADEYRAFLNRRAGETGEEVGKVGSVEAIQEIVVPSLKRELKELQAIGLPKGDAADAESAWQSLSTVVHQVEVGGIYAWHSAKLLPPFRKRTKQFHLGNCILN